MKISLDGGGLCTMLKRRYGNYTVTWNLIQSLMEYDKENIYYVYSFCERPDALKPVPHWRYDYLIPSRLWMRFRVSLEEFISKKDIFLGLNQAVPLYSKAKIITFSHGLSYYYFPHYYRDSYIRLSMQLKPMIDRSDYIIVSSQRVKEEMREAYPRYRHVYVIPFGVPLDFTYVDKRRNERKKYFLFVGMNHPIKNIRFVVKAFRKFRSQQKYRNFLLYLIGPEYMNSIPEDNIIVRQSAGRKELKELYRNATAYLTASHYESFNIPVLEALSQECHVIGLDSAIIPEMKKYVHITESLTEFVDQMQACTQNDVPLASAEKINNSFSWKTYAKRLTELY